MGSRLVYHLHPALQKFSNLIPRVTGPLSPGHLATETKHLKGCFQHIYDDLGVMVFAGVNAKQLNRIGDILERVVKNGGPGALICDHQSAPISGIQKHTSSSDKIPIWSSEVEVGTLTCGPYSSDMRSRSCTEGTDYTNGGASPGTAILRTVETPRCQDAAKKMA